MKRKYFYNYRAMKKDEYDRFAHGVITSDGDDADDGEAIYNYIMSTAKESYPDADSINITALNKI